MKLRKILLRGGVGISVIVILIWSLFPIFWMIFSSFKSEIDMYSTSPTWIFRPTIANYLGMIEKGFLKYLLNSSVVSVASMAISVVLGALAGYALSHAKFRGRGPLVYWIITTRMAPIAVTLLPLFILFRGLGLLNSWAGLIITYTTFNLPLSIWLLSGFFEEVPRELEDAALVDGCNPFRVFLRVSLPLVTPGLVVTAILCFIFAWNDYLFAATFSGSGTRTLVVACAAQVSRRGIAWLYIMCMGTLIFLPVVFVGVFIRKYLVRGLTMGAIR